MLNTNFLHNILNLINIVLAMMTAGLIATGCVATAGGGIDCSASWIDPKWTAIALIATNVLKVAINIGRDGLSGLTKPQPPVEQ